MLVRGTMKRKDMILKVSLELFNELGESNVTSVDIANELDISPGNLYYHFKGKEEIIASLIQNLSLNINGLILASGELEETVLVRWAPVYYFLEVVYGHRFFFRNVPNVLYNYPESGKMLIKILDQLQDTFRGYLFNLAESGQISISPLQKNLMIKLVKSIMLVLIYWESYQVLSRQKITETEFIQDASLQILSLISPYLNDEQIRDIHQCHQQYLRDRVARPVL